MPSLHSPKSVKTICPLTDKRCQQKHFQEVCHHTKGLFFTVWLEYLSGPCNLTVSSDSKGNAQIKQTNLKHCYKFKKSLQFHCNISFGCPKLHSVHLVSGNQKSLLYFTASVDYSVSPGTLSTLISYTHKSAGKKRGALTWESSRIFSGFKSLGTQEHLTC